MQNYISNRNIATQYQEKSCKSLGILLYLCGQILSKVDKTETSIFYEYSVNMLQLYHCYYIFSILLLLYDLVLQHFFTIHIFVQIA